MIAPSAKRCWSLPRVLPPVVRAPHTWTATVYPDGLRCGPIVLIGTGGPERWASDLCRYLTLAGHGQDRLVVRTWTMRLVGVAETISAGIAAEVEW